MTESFGDMKSSSWSFPAESGDERLIARNSVMIILVFVTSVAVRVLVRARLAPGPALPVALHRAANTRDRAQGRVHTTVKARPATRKKVQKRKEHRAAPRTTYYARRSGSGPGAPARCTPAARTLHAPLARRAPPRNTRPSRRDFTAATRPPPLPPAALQGPEARKGQPRGPKGLGGQTSSRGWCPHGADTAADGGMVTASAHTKRKRTLFASMKMGVAASRSASRSASRCGSTRPDSA